MENICALSRIESGGSRQHIGGQLLPVFHPQFFPDLGLVPLDSGCGDAHVGGDLLGCPVLGHQHGHGELRGGQIARHLLDRKSVV